MPEQLTFPQYVLPALGRGDYFVSTANALAVARVDDTQAWTNGKLALTGPEGAGKTHLAHVWANANNADITDHKALPTLDIPSIKTGLAVEIPETPLTPPEEEALFHLHNHMAAQTLPLLLIAREPPARWPIALPDLKSRMQATDVAQIDAPDEALLSAVLVKLFTDSAGWRPPDSNHGVHPCGSWVPCTSKRMTSARTRNASCCSWPDAATVAPTATCGSMA